MQSVSRIFNQWKSGVRLYIAIAALVTTVAVWAWTREAYGGTNLYVSRMEEVFAWLSLALIALAVSIGPFYKIFPTKRGKRIWFDARRLIGVSGAWFASLHVLIAYGSLFNFSNPLTLPQSYQQSFVFGGIALVILLAMAFTSFDGAFKRMGIWWFRLHRLVYVALLSILAHSFSIGVHATNSWVLVSLSVVAAILAGMHIARQKTRPSIGQLAGLSATAVLLFLVFNYGYERSRDSSLPSTERGYVSNG